MMKHRTLPKLLLFVFFQKVLLFVICMLIKVKIKKKFRPPIKKSRTSIQKQFLPFLSSGNDLNRWGRTQLFRGWWDKGAQMPPAHPTKHIKEKHRAQAGNLLPSTLDARPPVTSVLGSQAVSSWGPSFHWISGFPSTSQISEDLGFKNQR